MRHGVAGKVGVALHLHFIHNASSIAADRFYTDMKPVANFRQGDTGGNHSHHLVDDDLLTADANPSFGIRLVFGLSQNFRLKMMIPAKL